jgi:hypothetical protein
MQDEQVLPSPGTAMFTIARSIFWLTAAYLVIKPGADLPDAQALSAQALAAGTQVVAEQIAAVPCDTLHCVGSKAILAAALETSLPAVDPMHTSSTAISSVPYPRPRPDWRDSGRPPQDV